MEKNLTRRQALLGLGAAGLSASLSTQNTSAHTPTEIQKNHKLFPWVEKLTPDGKNPVELYGPCNGLSTVLLADESSTKKNTLLVAWEMPKGADYGVHYHKEYEMIYVLKGKLIIEIAEYNGPDGNPLKFSSDRTFTYQSDLDNDMQTVNLTDKIARYHLNEQGWIKIPGYAYHSVLPQENDSRILAYLPDAVRHDETPAKQWSSCPIVPSEH